MKGGLAIIVALVYIGQSVSGMIGLPKMLSLCHYGDLECIKDRCNVISRLSKNDGVSEINLESLDPIDAHEFSLETGTGPISFVMKLKNAKGYGISTGNVIDRVNGFGKDLNSTVLQFFGTVDRFVILADYDVDGKILVLPIKGNGKLNITIEHLQFDLKMKPTSVMRDGKEYAVFHKYKFTATMPKNVHYMLHNLFNGDQGLGGAVNDAMNQNWADVWNLIKKDLFATVGRVGKTLLTKVFATAPYADFFIDN